MGGGRITGADPAHALAHTLDAATASTVAALHQAQRQSYIYIGMRAERSSVVTFSVQFIQLYSIGQSECLLSLSVMCGVLNVTSEYSSITE